METERQEPRNGSPAFQFYPKEFLSSSKVLRMSNTEVGVYIKLLSLCWLDGSLPNDVAKMAPMVGVPAKQFARMWPNVLQECFVVKGERLINMRLEKERRVQADYRAKKKAAADARWSKHEPSSADAVHDVRNALQSPVTSSQSADRKNTHGRGSNLIPPRRKDAAWEGGRVWVPQRTHNDFVGYRNGNESELLAWYETVDREYASEIDPDMFNFWRARYREKWPTSSAAPKSKWGDWKPREAS